LLNLFSFSISPFNKKNIFIFYVNFDSHSFYFFILLLILFLVSPFSQIWNLICILILIFFLIAIF
jgi:hypothetical protein